MPRFLEYTTKLHKMILELPQKSEHKALLKTI
ncbi:hypothetical protein SAMN05421689_14515 [Leptospira interrogans]|nr:hypothetical protein SAMN05421689_14515 [Leptospira interrogans]